MKRQFVVTHMIRQTEILALLDSSVKNTPSVKMARPQNKFLSLHFRKSNMLNSWSTDDGSSFFCLL
jgi:hypothetical protein